MKLAKAKEYSRYEAAKETAASKGLVIRVPGPRELFIDIDSDAQLEQFNAALPKLTELLPLASMVCTPSPSLVPGRYHIVLALTRDLRDVFERILLQSLLGSDPVREMLSWQRAVRGDEVPTLFFERPLA